MGDEGHDEVAIEAYKAQAALQNMQVLLVKGGESHSGKPIFEHGKRAEEAAHRHGEFFGAGLSLLPCSRAAVVTNEFWWHDSMRALLHAWAMNRDDDAAKRVLLWTGHREIFAIIDFKDGPIAQEVVKIATALQHEMTERYSKVEPVPGRKYSKEDVDKLVTEHGKFNFYLNQRGQRVTVSEWGPYAHLQPATRDGQESEEEDSEEDPDSEEDGQESE